MPRKPVEAFADVYERAMPTPQDLVGREADAEVFEAFKDVKAAAHPERIAELAGAEYVGRGLLAHALFLTWRDRREAEFLLDAVRQHMMTQLRDRSTPHPNMYRLLEALTRFCDGWNRAANGAST